MGTPTTRPPRRLSLAVLAIACALLLLLGQNVVLARYFPHLLRVTTDFSPTYLARDISGMRTGAPRTIFLGDSVLWGYRLRADQTAPADLSHAGCACENLSFKASSPPNYFALVRLLENAGVRPRAVVIEVNQKVLNPVDSAYAVLHPSVEALALPLLTPSERALLTIAKPAPALQRTSEAALSGIWLTFAMRSDIRETMLGDEGTQQAKPMRALTSAMFEGTYDLSPLDASNVGVQFLAKTADRLRADGIPTIAFLTPTNHRLLHDYIDNREYRDRNAFLARLLRSRGVRVLDLDTRFPSSAFLDEVHLNAEAQAQLASILAAAIP